MFKNYLIITVRNIKNHFAYSIINILGLSIGMAVFILILLYVQVELSYDRYHDNADRIYRVYWHQPGNDYMGTDYFVPTQAPLASTLMEKYPEVVKAARLQFQNRVLLSHKNRRFLEDNIAFADP